MQIELNKYIDINYKEFNEKIVNTKYTMLGIKIPILKKIAKELLKNYNYKEILNNLDNTIYEHILIEGLVISYANIYYEERIKLISKYIPKIDNWAICDTFCSSLKFIKKYKKEFLKYNEKYLQSNKEYYLRFGIIILLDYYIEDEYINYIFMKIINIKSEHYYVKMALAWLISVLLVKYYDKTLDFLTSNKNTLDKWIYNKGIQKALESYRIDSTKKELLKSMKL